MGEYGFTVAAITVGGQQRVYAVIDVCRVVELQAAVVLVLGVLVDPGDDEGPLSQSFTT